MNSQPKPTHLLAAILGFCGRSKRCSFFSQRYLFYVPCETIWNLPFLQNDVNNKCFDFRSVFFNGKFASAKLQRFELTFVWNNKFVQTFTFWKPIRNWNVSRCPKVENQWHMHHEFMPLVVTLQLVVILRATPGYDRILKHCWKPPTVHVDFNWSSSMPAVETPATKGGDELGSYKVGPRIRLQIGWTTVDGWNPAPVDRWFIPLFIGFHTYPVVQDFFHQQY